MAQPIPLLMLYHEDPSSIFRTYIKLGVVAYICNPSVYNKVKGRDWRRGLWTGERQGMLRTWTLFTKWENCPAKGTTPRIWISAFDSVPSLPSVSTQVSGLGGGPGQWYPRGFWSSTSLSRLLGCFLAQGLFFVSSSPLNSGSQVPCCPSVIASHGLAAALR